MIHLNIIILEGHKGESVQRYNGTTVLEKTAGPARLA
jgi:hypothetical protein